MATETVTTATTVAIATLPKKEVREARETENTSCKETLLYVGSINPCIANGSTIHCFYLGKEFSRQGLSVDLVIPKIGKGSTLPFTDLTGEDFVVHQKGSFIQWGLPPSLNLIAQIPWILYYIVKKKIRCVYIRSNITSFVLVGIIRAFTKAFVMTEHNGLIADESIALGYHSWIGYIAKLAQALDAKLSHLVRVVTPGLKQYLINYGIAEDKIFVASNGTNIARLYPVAREQVLAQLNLRPDNLYIGFAGNLVVWQGLKIAMEAFASVHKQLPKVRFIIAGEGPEKNKLKEFARTLGICNQVKFLNHVPIESINIVMNAFDVCVAPFLQARNSKIGLSPIKIRDYAAAGRPVIAANITGIADESTHTWLMTHEPDNAEDLAKKLMQILLDEKRRTAMSKFAREYAEKNYQWSVVVEKILHQINHYRLCVA